MVPLVISSLTHIHLECGITQYFGETVISLMSDGIAINNLNPFRIQTMKGKRRMDTDAITVQALML